MTGKSLRGSKMQREGTAEKRNSTSASPEKKTPKKHRTIAGKESEKECRIKGRRSRNERRRDRHARKASRRKAEECYDKNSRGWTGCPFAKVASGNSQCPEGAEAGRAGDWKARVLQRGTRRLSKHVEEPGVRRLHRGN